MRTTPGFCSCPDASLTLRGFDVEGVRRRKYYINVVWDWIENANTPRRKTEEAKAEKNLKAQDRIGDWRKGKKKKKLRSIRLQLLSREHA